MLEVPARDAAAAQGALAVVAIGLRAAPKPYFYGWLFDDPLRPQTRPRPKPPCRRRLAFAAAAGAARRRPRATSAVSADRVLTILSGLTNVVGTTVSRGPRPGLPTRRAAGRRGESST